MAFWFTYRPSNGFVRVAPWEREREYERYEEARRKTAERRAAVERQATTLLLSYLSPEQSAQYRQSNSFDVVGSLGGNYRVSYGRAENISRRTDGATLCCGPRSDDQGERLPIPDVMLAQYLALITDEAAFLRVAAAEPALEPVSCHWPLCRSMYPNVGTTYYLR